MMNWPFGSATTKKPTKEGTKSMKAIHEGNVSTLKFYLNLILAASIIYTSVTVLFLWPEYTTRYIILSCGSLALCAGAYTMMSSMSQPVYGENDRGVQALQDVGLDLNMGPGCIAEHAKDTIILCCAVALLSLVHRYFWFLLLTIPARIFHMLWVNILSPWIFDPNQGLQVNEKKQKKMERKMRRIGHLTANRGQ